MLNSHWKLGTHNIIACLKSCLLKFPFKFLRNIWFVKEIDILVLEVLVDYSIMKQNWGIPIFCGWNYSATIKEVTAIGQFLFVVLFVFDISISLEWLCLFRVLDYALLTVKRLINSENIEFFWALFLFLGFTILWSPGLCVYDDKWTVLLFGCGKTSKHWHSRKSKMDQRYVQLTHLTV